MLTVDDSLKFPCHCLYILRAVCNPQISISVDHAYNEGHHAAFDG